ncbi:MAG: EamA family transporter [Chitinophagales bacterium]|nr:EamA family transporter [Chitinophagales bacterium]
MLRLYNTQSELTKAHLQMHLSILLWGATGVLGRGIDLSEGLLVWYRMLLVSLSLFLYVKFMGVSLRVSKENFWRLTGIGILLMIHWLFFYGAIKYSNVSITLSLFSSTTLFTALIEPLITKKKFNKAEMLYSILAMAGIGIIFYTDENSYTVGIVLALLAAFVGAFFNILNKGLVKQLPSSVVSFHEIFSGFAALTVFMPVYIWVFEPVKLYPTTSDWLLLLVLAVLCTHVTLILSLNALKHLSAFTLNLAINLEPVYGIALAFIFFRENKELNGWFFAGAGIIMLSVILHSYFEHNQED